MELKTIRNYIQNQNFASKNAYILIYLHLFYLLIISVDFQAVRKRTIVALSHLVMSCNSSLYNKLIDHLLEGLGSSTSSSVSRTHIQCIASIWWANLNHNICINPTLVLITWCNHGMVSVLSFALIGIFMFNWKSQKRWNYLKVTLDLLPTPLNLVVDSACSIIAVFKDYVKLFYLEQSSFSCWVLM